MPCNCGKKRVYVVTKSDGSTEEVATLTQAMTMVRKYGGRYQLIQKPR